MGFLSVEELAEWIGRSDPDAVRELHGRAYALKTEVIGRRVSMRGLVEAGNACAKDCLYCGIRKSNAKIERYAMSRNEIVSCARFAAEAGYGSLVIQSGEIESEAHTRFIEDVLRDIASLGLGVTLSLGEQEEDVYRRWRDAGATRYLLRIETSNPALYSALHPASCSFERRVECLRALRRCGYQVGTGVMSGLPGQTFEDLARDIVFFRDIDADMIGMGPYIPHPDTPLGAKAQNWSAERSLILGLNMIAATRLALRDVNIAAATALQALDPLGREKGLLAGANVVMPNITDVKYRAKYKLYAGKPCLDENADCCRGCLQRRIASIGETILWGVLGDSIHFRNRGEVRVEVVGAVPAALGLSKRQVAAAARFFAGRSRARVGGVWHEVVVHLVRDAASDAMHRAILGVDGATDVITQAYDAVPPEEPGLYGELFVNTDQALRAAPRRAGWSPARELLLYVAHGMDHLSGADDRSEDDYRRMRRRELKWLNSLKS